MAPLRYFVYVLGTIYVVTALVLLMEGLIFGSPGPEIIVPVFIIVTIAGIVGVASQRWN